MQVFGCDINYSLLTPGFSSPARGGGGPKDRRGYDAILTAPSVAYGDTSPINGGGKISPPETVSVGGAA